MITETMMLIALKQRNWKRASEMALSLSMNEPFLSNVAKVALKASQGDLKSAYTLLLWAEIKWKEIKVL